MQSLGIMPACWTETRDKLVVCCIASTKEVPEWRDAVPAAFLKVPNVDFQRLLQAFGASTKNDVAFQLGFATRMLFSCLVDADFLATESFMDPARAAERPPGHLTGRAKASGTEDLFAELDHYLADYLDQRFSGSEGAVGSARASVLAACHEKALDNPGLYSLNVPTGGGKTLSSLAFALRHCATHSLARVIYAIPFTSIIEQTADVFRDVFQEHRTSIDRLILEHHSNFDPDKETTRTRLATENWDAPIVVTTNAQLFESLFASKTSRCRKLHRIANSVIILDEAQTLPVTLLKPCLKVLELLVTQYGCTVVLCTATQPAIEQRQGFEIGLPSPTPIIEDASALYSSLKRVTVRDAGTLDCDDLANRMAGEKQGLAIVNTRRHAAVLYEAVKRQVDGDGCYHLSAAMTPDHRSQKLAEIRRRLNSGRACRVVATQLIEAGVDVDFPNVWRALAGLDSIAQAAGRCNREGKRANAVTWIFQPVEEQFSRLFGTLKTGRDAASQVIGTGLHDDLLGLEAIDHYFRLHYWTQQDKWDEERIFDEFTITDKKSPHLFFNFATVAAKFRFIDDSQRPIVVGWDAKANALVDELRRLDRLRLYPGRSLARRLQRQTVSVSQRIWQAVLGQQTEMLCDHYAVLIDPGLYYDIEMGLRLEADPVYDPALLITD